jgi:hypothetical protein
VDHGLGIGDERGERVGRLTERACTNGGGGVSGVRLGVSLPTSGKDATPEAIVQVAEEAERAGLGSVWTYERLLRPTVPIALGVARRRIRSGQEDVQGGQVGQDAVFADIEVLRSGRVGAVALVFPCRHR